jgi:hypothetical protein
MSITELHNPDEVKDHLRLAGVRAPSAHPRVNSEDLRLRWNGWNEAVAYGIDTNGEGVQFALWLFGDGGEDISGGGATVPSGLGEWIWDRVAFPVHLFPATPFIRYPEHTP